VWVNVVPEPKTAKHRLHLDVHTGSVAELEAMGAIVLDGTSFPWTVMADVEGGEFCAFVRDEPPPLRLYEIVVDTAAPAAIASWWGDVLGSPVVHDPRGYSYVHAVPGAPFEALAFVPVPEPKSAKNRIHVDVVTADLDLLVSAGATLVRPADGEIRWNVMSDPDGNEFCAFC
jgi:hypothetical protein